MSELSMSVKYLLPELCLAVGAVVVLFLGFWIRRKSILGVVSCVVVVVSAIILAGPHVAVADPFCGMLVNDPLAFFFRSLTVFVTVIVLLMSIGHTDVEEDDRAEFYFFLLLLAAALMVASSAHHLIMIYLAFEAVSIISYVLVGIRKRDVFSAEAGLKYFLFGTLSTGIMLYGLSIIYGLFGTLDLGAISSVLTPAAGNPLLLIALVFVLVGLGFKCSVAPFHMWVPDVYQGATTPVTAFLSVGPKVIGFALIIRVFTLTFAPVLDFWTEIVVAIAILSMTIANILALAQTNIKRLLAYSSISQAGYLLIGIAFGSAQGLQAVLFYLVAYAFMNLGVFAVVVMLSRHLQSDAIDDYAGLAKRAPFTAFVLLVSLLSLAGIPPLAGFIGKFYLLAVAVEAKLFVLAVAAVINSVIALYYYVRVVRVMYFVDPLNSQSIPSSFALQFALLITLVGSILFGVWPQPLLALIGQLKQIGL